MMRSFLALLLVIALTGCAALLIQPEDSAAIKAAKFTARVPLALVSAGFSEIAHNCAGEIDPPTTLGVEVEEDALPGQGRGTPQERARDEWARLTPQERVDRCWAEMTVPATDSSYAGSPNWPTSWNDPWPTAPRSHGHQHKSGRHHHHGGEHGC